MQMVTVRLTDGRVIESKGYPYMNAPANPTGDWILWSRTAGWYLVTAERIVEVAVAA